MKLKILVLYLFSMLLCSCTKVLKIRTPTSSAQLKCQPHSLPISVNNFKNGVNFVDYSGIGLGSKNTFKSLQSAKNARVNWIAIVISGCQVNSSETDIYKCEKITPSPQLVWKVAESARELGLRVMLKFQLDLTQDSCCWRGNIGQTFTESEWEVWFRNYKDFILPYLAGPTNELVNMVSIGNELTATEYRHREWRSLITRIRDVYDGRLIYGSNWNPGPDNITWWDRLDYIGVSAFYPLTDKNNPTIYELESVWKIRIAGLEKLSRIYQKEVIFTEVGYRSVSGSNIKPWDWESRHDLANFNEQASLYHALHKIAQSNQWLSGIFWWGWEANPKHGVNDTNYTPQGKPAEKVLSLFSCLYR